MYFDSQDVKLIGEAEEKLPLKDRIGYLLQEHHGLEVKDIASMLEKAEGTIRKTLHRNTEAFAQHKTANGPVYWTTKGKVLDDSLIDQSDFNEFGPPITT